MHGQYHGAHAKGELKGLRAVWDVRARKDSMNRVLRGQWVLIRTKILRDLLRLPLMKGLSGDRFSRLAEQVRLLIYRPRGKQCRLRTQRP